MYRTRGKSFSGWGFHDAIKSEVKRGRVLWPWTDERWYNTEALPKLGIMVAGNDIASSWATESDVSDAILDFHSRWGEWFLSQVIHVWSHVKVWF